MGCDQSKQKDVEQDRRRTVNDAGRETSGGVSAPIGIAAPQQMTEDMTGTSYTDQRIDEADAFAKIIANANEKFINVTNIAEPLTSADIAERTREYSNMLANQTVRVDLGKLPSSALNSSNDVVGVLLQDKPISDSVQETLSTLAEELASAFKQMQTSIEDVGPVVAHLPQASEQASVASS